MSKHLIITTHNTLKNKPQSTSNAVFHHEVRHLPNYLPLIMTNDLFPVFFPPPSYVTSSLFHAIAFSLPPINIPIHLFLSSGNYLSLSHTLCLGGILLLFLPLLFSFLHFLVDCLSKWIMFIFLFLLFLT